MLLPYLGILLRDHRAGLTTLPWWAEAAGDVETRIQVARDFLATVPLDWMAAEMCPPRAWREAHRVLLEGGRAYLEDRRDGTRRELRPEPPGGSHSWVTAPSVRSRDDIERVLPPLSHEQMLADGRLDFARRAVAVFGEERFLFASIGAPFWLAYGCLGFEGLMTALVERPELLDPLLQRLIERCLETVRAYAAAGIDGVWVEDCYSSADLISPEQWRRFALPHVERLIAETESLGLRAIHYYCGDIRDRLHDLVAVRPSALSLEESKKGFRIDLAQVAEVVRGRCALLGNLDAVGIVERADADALARALEAQAAVGRRWPRFAFSLGSPVTALTPMSRVQEYVRLARRPVGKH